MSLIPKRPRPKATPDKVDALIAWFEAVKALGGRKEITHRLGLSRGTVDNILGQYIAKKRGERT